MAALCIDFGGWKPILFHIKSQVLARSVLDWHGGAGDVARAGNDLCLARLYVCSFSTGHTFDARSLSSTYGRECWHCNWQTKPDAHSQAKKSCTTATKDMICARASHNK